MTREKHRHSTVWPLFSKTIIEEKMGGSISVCNVEQGAEFTVVIPLARDGQ